ncbi:MAG: hypothetical protein SNJ84_05990 [Verrucomicrobiia bacterium]
MMLRVVGFVLCLVAGLAAGYATRALLKGEAPEGPRTDEVGQGVGER